MPYKKEALLFRVFLKYIKRWPAQEGRKIKANSLLRENLKRIIRNKDGRFKSRDSLIAFLAKDLESLRSLTIDETSKLNILQKEGTILKNLLNRNYKILLEKEAEEHVATRSTFEYAYYHLKGCLSASLNWMRFKT